MDSFFEFINSNLYLIVILGFTLMFVLYIATLVKLNRIQSEYKKFIDKLGNGTNIEEILEKHIDGINKTIAKNDELEKYCTQIDNDIKQCIQKIGIYKYNAYKDSGNDLSFALALLDENNNGVVLNGIYSREMSNIYAKPVQNGNSSYTITEEENEAIKRAINS